jgi:hypothetical protein
VEVRILPLQRLQDPAPFGGVFVFLAPMIISPFLLLGGNLRGGEAPGVLDELQADVKKFHPF